MNIKTIKRFDKLNESQQKVEISPQQMMQDSIESDQQKVNDIFNIESNQFKFDCGIFIGNIGMDLDNPFSLRYYADKATDIDNFIELVGLMIESTNNKLSSSDVSRLKIEYKKLYPAA